MATETITLPYKETPYTVTANKKFHHSQTKTVRIDPNNIDMELTFELARKIGEWLEHTWTEPELFTTNVIDDINVRPENSHVQTVGKNGVRTYSEQREWIDDEWTGEWRNRTSSVTTQPVTQVEVNGTAVITWRNAQRTESIPYTSSSYETNAYYEDEVVVTTVGKNGVRTYTWQNEYMNNVATGNERNHVNSITTPVVNERVAIGTRKRSILSTEPKMGAYNFRYYYPWIEVPDPEKNYRVTSSNGLRIWLVNTSGNTGSTSIVSGTVVSGSNLVPNYYDKGLVVSTGSNELMYIHTISEYTIEVVEVD